MPSVRSRSDGQQVPLQRSWKRAWHGSTLHRIEQIAREGLKVGKKGSLRWEFMGFIACGRQTWLGNPMKSTMNWVFLSSFEW